jgi:hypothetical protein
MRTARERSAPGNSVVVEDPHDGELSIMTVPLTV